MVAVGQAPKSRLWILVGAVVLAVVLVGGSAAYALRNRWSAGNSGNAASPTQAPTSPGAASGQATVQPNPSTAYPQPTQSQNAGLPAAVGVVRLDPSLDPAKAPEVARLFDAYFTAVNARNADAALRTLDPGGSINFGNQKQVKDFTDGISTSSDDDILLLSIAVDTSGKGLLQARVTFRSQQASGKGPRGRESETCTRWDITYIVTRPADAYRIWGNTNAANRPC